MLASLMKILIRLERKVLPGLGVLLFAFSVTWMLIEALCREFFRKSFAVSEELIVFTLMWAIFLTLAQSGREHYHISVDLFTSKIPSKLRGFVDIFTSILSLIYISILLIASVQFIRHLYSMGFISESPLELPMWIVCLSVTVGAVLLCFYYLERLFKSSEKVEKDHDA